MQNQGILVQSHPELRASENARRETDPDAWPSSQSKAIEAEISGKGTALKLAGVTTCAGDAIRGQ
jgi:hypothetical protein